jgi:hypothetical protein
MNGPIPWPGWACSGVALGFLLFIPATPHGTPADRFAAEPGTYGIECLIEFGGFLLLGRIEQAALDLVWSFEMECCHTHEPCGEQIEIA